MPGLLSSKANKLLAELLVRSHRLIAKAVHCHRCDNGPELTSRHIPAWSLDSKIELQHIQAGKPTENAYVESFHGRLREECLRVSWFTNLFDAQRKISSWKSEYNEERPHSSLGLSNAK